MTPIMFSAKPATLALTAFNAVHALAWILKRRGIIADADLEEMLGVMTSSLRLIPDKALAAECGELTTSLIRGLSDGGESTH